MSGNQSLVEESDRWSIGIRDWTVTRCAVDYAFVIEVLDSDELISFRIGGRFVLAVDGQEHALDPEADGALALCPALVVLHRRVESAEAFKDGTLQLRFSGGVTISVAPDEDYEAWEAAGGWRGIHLVCLPGGGLAVWESVGTPPLA